MLFHRQPKTLGLIAICVVVLAGLISASSAQAAILLNFGATISNDTNSPSHQIGGVTGTNWNLITTNDVISGIVTDSGAATTVGVILGVGSGGLMDWSTQPTNAAALGSQFSTGIYSGNGRSATYIASGEVGVRITGLAPGVYDLYISGRNTNAPSAVTHRYYYETVGSASGNTSYSTANSLLVQYESATDFLANTPTTWDEGIDFAVIRYTIAAGEDIVVAASSRGFIATIGVVLVPEPASAVLMALGSAMVLLRRRS